MARTKTKQNRAAKKVPSPKDMDSTEELEDSTQDSIDHEEESGVEMDETAGPLDENDGDDDDSNEDSEGEDTPAAIETSPPAAAIAAKQTYAEKRATIRRSRALGNKKTATKKNTNAGGSGEDGKKKRKAKNGTSRARTLHLQSYIHKVAKSVNPEMRVHSGTMAAMHSMMTDLFDRLASEASSLRGYGPINSVKTLTTREVKTAARLMLPGEVASHAIREIDQALQLYDEARD